MFRSPGGPPPIQFSSSQMMVHGGAPGGGGAEQQQRQYAGMSCHVPRHPSQVQGINASPTKASTDYQAVMSDARQQTMEMKQNRVLIATVICASSMSAAKNDDKINRKIILPLEEVNAISSLKEGLSALQQIMVVADGTSNSCGGDCIADFHCAPTCYCLRFCHHRRGYCVPAMRAN